MAGQTLTTASQLQCPHGGKVQIQSSSRKAAVAGSAIATIADTFLVTGCPFLLPPFIPSPCVTVRWLVADGLVSVGNQPTLSETSVGLCYSAAQVPQGAVIVQATQSILGTQ